MNILQSAKDLSGQTNGEGSFTILHDFPSPDVEKAWRGCLCRVECPAHYNSPEFFAEPHWAGKRPFAVLALERGNIVGVLTGLHQGDEVISGLSSRPQICVDKTADRSAALDTLAQGLLAEADSAKMITVYTWNWLPLSAFEAYNFRHRQFEGNVVLDLRDGPEALFRQFHENRRRNIRYAMRQEVEISQATGPEDSAAFYCIYLRWRQTTRKRINGEQLPREVFERRYYNRENVRFFLARYSGRVIAGITLRFFAGGMVEFANNSSLDEFLHLRPNDLLQWRAIEWICSEGFNRYSLGGAHLFLRKFGGMVVPIHRYRLDRTFFRYHDLGEAALDVARASFRKFPHPVQKTVRIVFGK